MKSLPYLGYFPNDLRKVPREVREFIVHQLHLPWDFSNFYPADERTRGYHYALIRKHTGGRAVTTRDKNDLAQWLRTAAMLAVLTEEDLLEHTYERLCACQIELPAEKELRRLVHAALHGFFHDLYARLSTRIAPAVRAHVDTLLVVPPGESGSAFEKLKVDPARPGVENLKKEITKLQTLRAVGITESHVAGISPRPLQLLKRRAVNERAGEMREHPEPIRYTLMACFVQVRTSEVIDDITRMTMQLLHRIEAQSEFQLVRERLQDVKRITGKLQILYRVAEAVTAHPDGTVRQVIFPQVKEAVFHDLVPKHDPTCASCLPCSTAWRKERRISRSSR